MNPYGAAVSMLVFANKASLNKAKSLNPIPPSDLVCNRVSHFTQWTLLQSPFCPLKNLLIKLSIFVHRPTESLKQLIMYMGESSNLCENTRAV